MWISEVDDKILRTWVKHCPALKLVSTADFRILYANDSFCEWIGYTLKELQSIGWKRISVDDESLQADIKAVNDIVDGYQSTYRVQKQYIPKNGKPEWGLLSVMRYPATGDLVCFLCTFEPLKNGTQTAFNMAMERIGDMTTQIGGLRNEVGKLTSQDEETTWINATVRMCRKHPRVAASLLAMALGIFGANNILELSQRLGIVDIPVPLKKAIEARETAGINISEDKSDRWIITTVDGNVIETPVNTKKEQPAWRAKTSEQH
jgi:PAS domain S-box-containing protein